MTTYNYRVAGAYITGRKHEKDNKPCQDRTYTKSSNGVTVISLADGAGGKGFSKKSDVGAEIATEYVSDFICENFDTLFEKEEKIISKTILEGISKNLSQKAKLLNFPVLEFSSTLLFVGVKDNRYLAGHIGDGLIGYFENKKVKTLSYPENGDSPNKTFFTTGDNAINYFRIYKADKDYYTDYYPIGSQESIKKDRLKISAIKKLNNITGFILMSDGSYDCLFDKKEKRLQEGNIKRLFSWLEDQNIHINDIEESLKETMKELFPQKTLDDCSINALVLTKDKVKMEDTKKADLTFDIKQLANNTKRIVRLEEDVSSVKNDFKKYKSVLNKSTSNQADNTNRINQLQENVTSTKNELKDFQNEFAGKLNKSDSDQESVLTEDMKSIIKWKQNVNILLLIISTGLAGIIIKLLFFN